MNTRPNVRNGPAYANSNPLTSDSQEFVRCQCTSYVASKLSALFNARYYNNGAPANLVRKFRNTQYYMPQTDRSRWSHGRYWRDAAIFAGIGVTGARDNFTWDERSYNAVFVGDVAWWDAWTEKRNASGVITRKANPYGHVAYVESVEPDVVGLGVKCVTISDYNWNPYNFRRKTVCKADGIEFPDAFLHIDRDHSYCTANPTKDNCPALWGGQVVASSGTKADGLGGSLDTFNLKQDFDILDPATGNEWRAGIHTLFADQRLRLQVEVAAEDGDLRTHLRPGQDSIKIDYYYRPDDRDWIKYKTDTIQARNLGTGKKVESEIFTVPSGIREISFKVKVDADDDAYESNEGDNGSRIETFTVENVPTRNFIVGAVQLTVPNPVFAGNPLKARMAIRNTGNTLPETGIRSNYSIRGPGTNFLWMQIADDGSDAGDFTPGRDQWEEMLSPATAPTMPGTYELRGCADYQNAVPETDEQDNCLTTSFTVVPRPAPSLTIADFRDDRGCCTTNTGNYIDPRIWIKNNGPAAPVAPVPILYQISSPQATAGNYIFMGSGTLEPRELSPGATGHDGMDNQRFRIPKTKAWKKQTHTIRACIMPDGSPPLGGGPGELCATYTRYSRE